jgi:hypothetical protein
MRRRSKGCRGNRTAIQITGESDICEASKIDAEDVAAEGVVDKLSFTFGFDKPGVFEFFHVVGEGGGANGDAVANVSAGATGARCLAKFLKNFITARIGESTRDEVKLAIREGDLFCRRHVDYFTECGRVPRGWLQRERNKGASTVGCAFVVL